MLLPLDGNHEEAFFSPEAPEQQSRKLSRKSSKSTWGPIPPKVEDLLGREVETQELLQLTLQRRFVEVQGVPGIGKSVLLSEAGRFMQLRRESFEEVVYVSGFSCSV